MAKIIAISNQKGGVGKTTSTVNIGAALALKKFNVLLIDLDSQANLTQCLGLKEFEYSIYESLIEGKPLKSYPITAGVDLVPSSVDLAVAESDLGAVIAREFKLKKLIDPIKKKYDYILIDCPPSLGLLCINAFVAADEIYIPIQPEILAHNGFSDLYKIFELIREDLNTKLTIGGIIITLYDQRKTLNRDLADKISNEFKDVVFKARIRDNVALAEAPYAELDIFRYNKKSHGAEDYMLLCNEIIKRNKNS